jgi:hypothetical protein
VSGFVKAPITLQRQCQVRFDVVVDGVDESVASNNLQGAVSHARFALEAGAKRVQVCQVMTHDTVPANLLAKAQEKQNVDVEVTIATWEVFAEDLVFSPAGRRGLAPEFLKAALELQENDPREVVES